MASGILFLTYATLRSQRHDQCSRLQQILEWTGAGFEGVILFDESHSMGNAAGTKDERSEEHTSELQSLMRISYAVFCLKKKTKTTQKIDNTHMQALKYTYKRKTQQINTHLNKH